MFFKLNKIKTRAALATIIVIIVSACGGGDTNSGGQPPVAVDTTPRVIAIGDSIGNGFGIANPWPPRLSGLIGIEVVNTSVTNEQTSFGVANIQSLITQNNPSHVFILLGTNDALRGSVSAAISNLQTMVDIARQNDVIPVVGTLPPITFAAAENDRAARISQGIRSLNGARVAPVRGMLGSGADTIADGIHPNDRGQQIIAEAFSLQF